MLLKELIANLPLRVVHGDVDVSVNDVADDSRRVGEHGPGCLFVARRGVNQDGRSFIAEAVGRGAVAVVTDRTPDPLPQGPAGADGPNAVWIVADNVDQVLTAQLAERFFDHPSHKLKLIGVTGTNGKTTTSLIAAHLLTQAGVPCGVTGTVYVDDGRQQRPAELTTPGPIELSRTLATMVENGCGAAVVEVSSHALHQGRIAALQFDAAIFTNLTGDHLDYHRTMQDYADEKAKLFEQLDASAWAVVNSDDPHTARVTRNCRARLMRCTLEEVPSDHHCHAAVLGLAADHSRARLSGPWGSVELRLPMVGRHNVANALQALAAVNAISLVNRKLCRTLESLPPVPGRLEPVGDARTPGPAVLVDYAHTDDALQNVLTALCPLTQGRLIVVFGCGGDRDRTKRPRMAAVACRLADRVIITSDNPRTEDPMAVIDDILAGVPEPLSPDNRVQVEPDRAKAIDLAVAQARADDTVLLAGKGHEPYQEIGATRRHFDDREQAANALRRHQRVWLDAANSRCAVGA